MTAKMEHPVAKIQAQRMRYSPVRFKPAAASGFELGLLNENRFAIALWACSNQLLTLWE